MKQTTQYLMLGIIMLLVVSTIAFSFFWNPPYISGAAVPQGIAEARTTGTTNTGDVEITITPLTINKQQATFQLGVNTHSVDLSKFSLQQQATLEADGKTYKPSSAPKLSGHHTSGNLIFNTNTELKGFKIIIGGIPQINQRIFTW